MNYNTNSLTLENNTPTEIVELPTTTTTSAITSINSTKEKKRGWFHSLTRRRKTQSQSSINLSIPPPSYRDTNVTPRNQSILTTSDPLSDRYLQTNNNNEPLMRSCNAGLSTVINNLASADAPSCSTSNNSTRKRKDEKNAFQRLRKRIGLHFPSLRRNKHSSMDGATTDASSEFLTHSPIHEPLHFNFKRSTNSACARTGFSVDETDVPFTNDFKRFIRKKWLEHEEGPNLVMYEASCEMLNQVWYWGEISRRDAQKQLTDKPTGSFLVRDSETSGSQFTLSFRIINVTLHYRLEYRNDYWHFEELQYESIVEMIEDILYRCTNDNFVCFVKVPNEMQPPFPVILKYPLSRYLSMPKLQDLCRRSIQRSTKPEDIAHMSIPPGLQEYLAEIRELVF